MWGKATIFYSLLMRGRYRTIFLPPQFIVFHNEPFAPTGLDPAGRLAPKVFSFAKSIVSFQKMLLIFEEYRLPRCFHLLFSLILFEEFGVETCSR